MMSPSNSTADGWANLPATPGYISTCPAGSGSPASRNRRDTAAARFPPALSPATATDDGASPNRRTVGQRPAGDGFTVVQSGGIGVLGSQPVAHRHHNRARAVGQLSGDVVHEPDAPDDETTSVEVDDQPCRLAIALVDTDRDVSHLLVGDVGDLPGRWKSDRAAGQFEDDRIQILEWRRPFGVGCQPLGHPGVEHTLVVHLITLEFSYSGRPEPVCVDRENCGKCREFCQFESLSGACTVPSFAPGALPSPTSPTGILSFPLVFIRLRLRGQEPPPLGRGVVPAVPLFGLDMGSF